MRLFTFIYCSLIFILGIHAQDFEVAPVVMKFNVNPGEIDKQKLHVVNHSEKKQKFTFKFSDYIIDANGEKISKPAGSTPRTCADWITVNPSFVELAPNQEVDVEVLMTVPKNGYNTRWGMLSVEAAVERSAAEADKSVRTGILLVPRIIVFVLQSPSSNNNYNASISNLRETGTNVNGFKEFEVTINNTGDKIITAEVSLALANIETAQEQKFDPKKKTVYPGSSIKMTLTLPKKIGPGKYALAAMLDYGHRSAIEATQILLEQ